MAPPLATCTRPANQICWSSRSYKAEQAALGHPGSKELTSNILTATNRSPQLREASSCSVGQNHQGHRAQNSAQVLLRAHSCAGSQSKLQI
jgi:hypothetical protein